MSIISDLLNQVMSIFYSFSGDWGITILLTTVVIRIFLLPFSWNQKKRLRANKELSEKVEALKQKYKNDKLKLQAEMMKLTSESAKGIMGFFVTLVQIPVMYSLYKVFSAMPIELGSILVPWVFNLKLPDTSFIFPLIVAFVQLLPNILLQWEAIKTSKKSGVSIGQLILIGGINVLFMAKAPVTICLYWFTSGVFNLLEQIVYSKLTKNTVDC